MDPRRGDGASNHYAVATVSSDEPTGVAMFEELSIRENVELPFRLGGHPASGHPASERAARLNGLLDDLEVDRARLAPAGRGRPR